MIVTTTTGPEEAEVHKLMMEVVREHMAEYIDRMDESTIVWKTEYQRRQDRAIAQILAERAKKEAPTVARTDEPCRAV